MKDYSIVTGAQIVSSIRRHNIWIAVSRGFLILFVAALLVFGLWYGWKERSWFMLIIGVLICAFVFYLLIESFGSAVRTLSDIRRARVFLKYGGPDALAMRISEGVPQMQIGSTFVTDTYIMQTGNFETFVAFEEILLLYRHEHSTNGVKDGIALMVHDAFGDKFKYPFKLGKRHADEMQDAVQIIMQRADRAALGYTNANLEYAKINARKPADE